MPREGRLREKQEPKGDHRDQQSTRKNVPAKSPSRSRSRQAEGRSRVLTTERVQANNRQAKQSKIERPRGIKNSHFNPRMLANIIADQKKMNSKLDLEETTRAAQKFKLIFREDIHPVTMSSFLSNEELVKRVQVKHSVTQGSPLCQRCERHFESETLLQEHLANHP